MPYIPPRCERNVITGRSIDPDFAHEGDCPNEAVWNVGRPGFRVRLCDECEPKWKTWSGQPKSKIRKPKDGTIVADDLLDAVFATFHGDGSGRDKGQRWAYFREFPVGSDYGGAGERRLDGFAIGTVGSTGFAKVAYEVKLSRADFTKELKEPEKRRLAMLYSNHFSFVAPKGLIKPDELPAGCGLIEIDEEGCAHEVIKSVWRDCAPPTWMIVASMARLHAKQEFRCKVLEQELTRAKKEKP